MADSDYDRPLPQQPSSRFDRLTEAEIGIQLNKERAMETEAAKLATLADKAQQDPDSMPEIVRELTMLKGAVASLHSSAKHLIDKVVDITRPDEVPQEKRLAEVLPTSTALAIALREITNEVSMIEDKIASATYRIEL